MSLIAHGSGWDEFLLFLGAPTLYLLYRVVKRLLGHGESAEPVEAEPSEKADEPGA